MKERNLTEEKVANLTSILASELDVDLNLIDLPEKSELLDSLFNIGIEDEDYSDDIEHIVECLDANNITGVLLNGPAYAISTTELILSNNDFDIYFYGGQDDDGKMIIIRRESNSRKNIGRVELLNGHTIGLGPSDNGEIINIMVGNTFVILVGNNNKLVGTVPLSAIAVMYFR